MDSQIELDVRLLSALLASCLPACMCPVACPATCTAVASPRFLPVEWKLLEFFCLMPETCHASMIVARATHELVANAELSCKLQRS